MPFKKISLKSRQRKKKILSFKKKIGIVGGLFGVFTIGTILFVPKLIGKLFQKKHKSHAKIKVVFGVVFIFVALIIALVGSDSGKEIGGNVVKNAIFTLGSELPKDKNGYTNILLLGSGGEEHAGKGAKLTDSIMIISIDVSGRNVVMLSIPRDLYIETEHVRGRINEIIRDESTHILNTIIKVQPENAEKLKQLKGDERQGFLWKLEAEADEKAAEIMKEKIEDIFQIDIHRTARIDFRGFEKFVDAIGGIDVVVEKTIDDSAYPDFDWGFNPFHLEAGPQKLDGSTALKYARSRHGTSDFDRAKRQQKVITAIKEKMTSLKTLTSPSKLKGIFDVLQENYISDITWEEIITLAEFASKLPKDRISNYVLNDDPTKPGGFLVTPNRDLYGGAFVLVPFLNLESDKYAQIRDFAKIIFENRILTQEDATPIVILNGTKRKGIAGSLQIGLERYGWKISEIDNAENNIEKSRIEYPNTPEDKQTAMLLSRFFPAELVEKPEAERENVDVEGNIQPGIPDEITITLGADYQSPYRIPDLSF